ncbi:hypothetical protein CPB97_009252 [Podila verticillata]|nr:hypothetical protein CPB97_009252 [Podila verticillata]
MSSKANSLPEENWSYTHTPTSARVIIVGCGIGGLTLAAFLERAGIQYQIFERAREVRPLGSALSMGSNVMYIFQQLGILEIVLRHAKPFSFSTGYNEKREATRTLDYSPAQKIGGYLPHIIARPILYDILRGLVPAYKICMGKKILSLLQNREGVMIRCSDNTSYHADILVGADGANSGVRQSLYKSLLDKNELPKSDNVPLPFNSTCLVGQTRPLDPAVLTHLQDAHTWFETTIGENKPYAWVTFTSRHNTVCWMVLRHLDTKASRELESSFRNSEWGPEAAEAMCKEVRDFPIPRANMTIGDLIDATPKELISKVMLEEKIFDTWHGGRTVLLGDGAVSAMHDAVTLANCLYELPKNPSAAHIHKAFQLYKTERYPLAKAAYDSSHRLAAIVGQSWYNDVIRALMRHMPKSVFTRSLLVMYSYRPQATFLPYVKDLGQIKPAPQASLARAQARKAAQGKAKKEQEGRKRSASTSSGAAVI